jgi:hypothetical protein
MNDNPICQVAQVPITEADRAAMLYKHPLETKIKESRTRVSPTLTLLARRATVEIYRHEQDGVVKIFDIRAIKNKIYQNTIPVSCLLMTLNEAYVNHIFAYGGCEQEHIDRITEEDIKRPAIGVLYPDGLQIVDGSHRIVSSWRRFKKETMRLLVVPGELEFLFLCDPKDFPELDGK